MSSVGQTSAITSQQLWVLLWLCITLCVNAVKPLDCPSLSSSWGRRNIQYHHYHMNSKDDILLLHLDDLFLTEYVLDHERDLLFNLLIGQCSHPIIQDRNQSRDMLQYLYKLRDSYERLSNDRPNNDIDVSNKATGIINYLIILSSRKDNPPKHANPPPSELMLIVVVVHYCHHCCSLDQDGFSMGHTDPQ